MKKATNIFMLIIALTLIIISISFKSKPVKEVVTITKTVKVTVVDTVVNTVTVMPDIHELKGTHYNAVVEQCDSDPFTTADMSHIDIGKLNTGNVRWVALSRDMLSRWGGPYDYGDTIYVYHDQPELRGIWYVHDCMNARYEKRIDFLVPLGNGIPGKSRAILISKESFLIER
jgi:hypothetical protein